MGSLTFAFLAAGCTAFASLLFRKNGENSTIHHTPSGYLVLFYLTSLLSFLVFYPDSSKLNINFIMLSVGALVGILNSILMILTSRALSLGPAGLTFAFQNASAIFPGLILFLLLGSDFGYSCSYLQMTGMMLVLFGLFLGAKNEVISAEKSLLKWLKYALACFLIQILALTFIQARCLLFSCGGEEGFFSYIALTEADDLWFMPGQFGTSFVMQAAIFLQERKRFLKSEVIYGCLGGIANFSSTCLLLLATKFALPLEKGILFPLFAVATLILSNIWANRLYNEKLQIKTNILCSLGIFMAVSN